MLQAGRPFPALRITAAGQRVRNSAAGFRSQQYLEAKLHSKCLKQDIKSKVPAAKVSPCLQDREATLQCILCLRAKVELRKSFSCSTDCLRQHWNLHKDLHSNGELPSYSLAINSQSAVLRPSIIFLN